MTLAVVLAVLGAGLFFFAGRLSQRYEHKPHWDELVRLRRQVTRLEGELVEWKDRLATVADQRNKAMEAVRRLRDQQATNRGAP